jgi:hypothetical protein
MSFDATVKFAMPTEWLPDFSDVSPLEYPFWNAHAVSIEKPERATSVSGVLQLRSEDVYGLWYPMSLRNESTDANESFYTRD